MTYDSNTYRALFVLHILAVMVAFGPWFLTWLIPAEAHKRGSDAGVGTALNEVYFRISTITQYAMYAVVIFGFALVGASKIGSVYYFKVEQEWVWLALLAWVAVLGVLHGVVLPAQRGLKDATGDVHHLTHRQELGVGVMNVLVVAVLVLMVFKPGA